MAEPRDRLVREDPITPMLMMSGRRSNGGIWQDSVGSESMGSSRLSVGGGRNLFGSPIQSTTRSSMEVSPSQGIWRRNGSYGTPRINRVGSGFRRNLYRTPMDIGTGRRRGGRGRHPRNNNTLPSWYPRTPFRDITAIVDAIERRRAQMREADRHRLANPTPQEPSVSDPNQSSTSVPLEPDIFLTTPNFKAAVKVHHEPIHHLPLGNYPTKESDFMTPQKKLLDSIDQVERVVMEEFRRMKRTPSAKRAERAKKVRTLMTMR